jgi:PAS domain S-box-containing protein
MSDPRPPGPTGARPHERAWRERTWARYALAAAAVAACALLTYVLRLGFSAQNARVIFAFFYLAVFVSVWFGGRRPALFSVALSLAVADLLFLPTSLLAPDFSGLIPNVFFLGISLMAVFLLERSRRAEREARDARGSLETTLKSIGDAVISTDNAGRVRFMNPAAERLTGRTLEQAEGRPLAEVFRIVNERTRETVESPVEKVLREGRVVGLANHTVLLARDGSEIPIDDSGAPIRDAAGRIAGVVLVFHDITERRAAESALRESEGRFGVLADTAPVMIWMSDADKACFYFNKPWLDFTGRTLEEESGDGWFEGVHPDDRGACFDTYDSSFDARGQFKMEYRVRRHDGEYRWVLSHGVPRYSQAGRFLGYVGSCIDIHERRLAEAERSLLAAIVETSQDAVIGKTLDGTITSWNESAARMYGHAAAEAVGRNISLVVPEERMDELASILARVGRGESVENLETVRVSKGGARLDVSLTISPIRDASGRWVGASTIARDISGHKRAEAERARLSLMVERERERLRNLVADVPGVVWEAWGAPEESGQRINFVSDHVEKMLGYTVGEWLSTPNFWLSIVHPEDRERAAEEAHAIFESRAGGVSRFRWVRKDGRAVSVESQSSVILDERGEPAGMRGVTMDITERRAAEERLRFIAEASRVLASSLDYEATLERLARLSVAALADYCLIDLSDAEGAVRRVAASHVDPACRPLVERLREYPPEAGRSVGVPEVLRTGEPVAVPEVTDEVLASMTRDEGHAALLRELGLKSFVTVPLVARERTIGALTFASTRARRAYTDEDVSFAQEIASRAALAIENARLYKRAQEVNRAKDEFLATLSHELRTPLTPILGWTHMIRSGRLGDEEVGRGVRVIEKNSQSLSRLINDLLDMSSILSGKMRIEREPVELASVLREAVETVRPQAEARRVALEASLGGASPTVSGDRTRLVQVFWNLLNNAVKFSPEGGRVRVRLDSDGGREASVRIEDEGEGITPDFLPHVFERFRQADMGTTRAHGGLGIGLALVKSFVEAHGGAVRAASAGEGLGSRFTVTLPSLGMGAAGRASGDLAPVGEDACAEETCRVLLIEDAPDTLDMLRVVFEARGYAVTPCAEAEEALRVAESARFDIIVSDIGLPRIDGYELLGRLRSVAHMRGVPAVALTGYAAPRDAEAALAAGFDAHVAKPVDPLALVEQVELLVRPKGEADS